MSWKEIPQDEWDNPEFAEAATWVLGELELGEEFRAPVEDLLEDFAPEDVTHHLVREWLAGNR